MGEETVITILLAINLIAFAYISIGGFIKISGEDSTKLSVTFRPKSSFFLAIFTINFFFLSLLDTSGQILIHKITCEHSIKNISNTNIDSNPRQDYLPTNCNITDIGWFKHEKNPKLISNIIEAKVEKIIEFDEHHRKHVSYQIFLLTQSESIPFADYMYLNYEIENIKKLTSSINNFLINNEEKELIGIVDDRVWSYIVFGICLFFGMIILLLTLTGLFVNFTFDKETNIVTVSRYRCFGMFGKKVTQYPFDDIIDIKYNRIELDESGYRYQVFLVVPENEIRLNPIGMISSNIDGSYIVMVIKKFLGRWN
ncbi:hypothetical protein [Rivularia sp. UHCC 0363]|uniref:hypothetical protein n=1 Tax=Rivularia sp. UHCC 0363 TaxID=3110244 RepID=UPI002B20C9A1|nr:hypothetical protein [Rivularia sp. UHCC 0363]MEA5596400.1 hypothetical protein [Rivularia sp. UHCC 0363]